MIRSVLGRLSYSAVIAVKMIMIANASPDMQAIVKAGASYEEHVPAGEKATNIHGFTVFDQDHRPVCLDKYRGKV